MKTPRSIPPIIIAFGVVSLFADITYEGGRSIIGPYMGFLQASGTIVGILSLGELVMYLSRGLGGYLASRARTSLGYWSIIFIGYTINLFSVPLLAYAPTWQAAFALVLLERTGKGLRVPARDALISEASKGIGRGKGFAVHEVLDQTGAVLGPLYVSLTLRGEASYYAAYLSLWAPALLSLASLVAAYKLYPTPATVRAPGTVMDRGFRGFIGGLPGTLKLYMVLSTLFSMVLVQWALISYHLSRIGWSPSNIALLYTVAMGVDAFSALAAGVAYDRRGLPVLLAAPASAALSSLAFIPGSTPVVLVGIIMWGVMMGLVESTMRAAIGDLSPEKNAPGVYGLYGLIVGLAGFVGNAFWGCIYDSHPGLVAPLLFLLSLVTLFSFTRLLALPSGSEQGKP